MRFRGEAYRAHDPRWSFKPLSGAGAAIGGGRFNPPGVEALYLALTPITAVKEANQGFARKIDPLVLCTYEVDCEDVVDLRETAGRKAAKLGAEALACGWKAMALRGEEPPTWAAAKRLVAAGTAGVLVPSFAPGADAGDHNLVLWRWGPDLPHRVTVHDPSGRLPKNQLSWR